MTVPTPSPDDTAIASHPALSLSVEAQEQLTRTVMRRQAALSLRVAAVFTVLLLGLPLVNAFLPDLANTSLFGFSATWLFLGILFYPITILLSIYFVRHSDRIEAETVERARSGKEPA